MASIQFHYDTGDAISGRVTTGATVKAGTLVRAAAVKTDGEPIAVAPCGATEHPIGVVDADGAEGDLVTIHRVGVGHCVASAAITFGSAVQASADGKVAAYSSGIKVGVALTSAPGDQDPVLVALAI